MTRTPFACAGWLALVAQMIVLPQAAAQDSRRADPADSRAPVPGLKYDSALSDYQPFRGAEPRRSWKEANQDVADNPGMGRMASKPGAAGHDMGAMPGMSSKAGAAPDTAKAAAAGHDMAAMPGMGAQRGAAPKSKQGGAGHDMAAMGGTGAMPAMASRPGDAHKGAGGHDMGSTKNMPGMSKSGAGKDEHGAMATGGSGVVSGQSGKPENAKLAGTGIVRAVDKANGKVKLTHDPIAAMGWPAMTLSFRLKDNALADQLKAGDKVEFSLEKSAAGYVISALHKRAGQPEAKPVK
jgi:Cu/Ag efflux protein CusF